MRQAFDLQEMKWLEPTTKIGLLATLTPTGLPHVSLITSIQAKTPTQLVWGQFTEGISKENVRRNPHTAFLVLTLDRRMWRGRARWTSSTGEGADYEMLNRKPMFRYNSYFGIHTVHYMDLVRVTEQESLPLPRIVAAALATNLLKHTFRAQAATVMNPWTRSLFDDLRSLKFLTFVKPDGFPWIVPALQCQVLDESRLVFSPFAYRRELKELRPGAAVAVFGLTLKMESVLVRGRFVGFTRRRLISLGQIELDYVYNSMPPNHRQIYPPVSLEPVRSF